MSTKVVNRQMVAANGANNLSLSQGGKIQRNFFGRRAFELPMEKLAFLERRRLLGMEVEALRQMRARLAFFGKRPKQLEQRLMLDRRMKEARSTRNLSTPLDGLIAAE
jgi:hypothetical protein